jgi:HEAT repeat protein
LECRASFVGTKLGFAVVTALVLMASPAPARAFDWIGKVELDAEDLKAKEPDKRAQAVQKLGQYDIRWTRKYLLKALKDPDFNVRATAGRLLGRARVKEALPVVSEWLTSTAVDDKKVAAEILGAIGTPEAVPLLIRALGDPDYEVRLQSVLALGQIGGERVVLPIIARLEDEKPEVRRAAVDQLMHLLDARAVVPLVALFDDSSTDVRESAVLAVGRLGDEAAAPALLRLLRDPSSTSRIAAIAALGNIRSARAIPSLVELLTQGPNEIRAKAAYALGQIASAAPPEVAATAVAPLVLALTDGRIKVAAREGILAAGKNAVPSLIAHLRGDIAGDSEAVVELLRDVGDARATEVLIEELERARLPRDLILAALAKTEDPRALVPVLTLLGSDDPTLRVRAIRALEGLVRPGGRGSDVLILALSDKNEEVRARAASYLGRMGSHAAVNPLIALLGKESSVEVKKAAALALGEIGDERATPVLLKTFRSGGRALHSACANALSELRDEKAIAELIDISNDKAFASRPLAVRTIGAIVRDRDHGRARRHLETLAESGDGRVVVAALGALGAMRDTSAVDVLIDVAGHADLEQKRAALKALGDIGDEDGKDALRRAMRSKNDRVASAAAWALGKIGDKDAAAALFAAARRRDFATPVNASAALVLLAPAGDNKAALALLHHRSPFVRANACELLARLRLKNAREPLSELLKSDRSWLVRVSAARALSRLEGADLLSAAKKRERQKAVLDAIEQGLAKPFAPRARSEWRTFTFVDPARGDRPLTKEPYFLVTADNLVTAFYTDDNGEATEEAFPPGEYALEPALRASDY